jgi:hypothetical protein
VSEQLTHHPSYDTLERDDFISMIQLDRYADRTDDFDDIIAATVDHLWDPADPRYLEFDKPFDQENDTIMPRDFCVELQCEVAEKLDEGQKIRLANQNTRFQLSSILHGEQGALSLSASLALILRDPGAQEYAANQTREEARHVQGFSRYIALNWGTPLSAGPTLSSLLQEVVVSQQVYKKLIGMQMLIEGLAMGAFATISAHTNDPLLRRLIQFTMTDEAFHHKFGRIWANKTIPNLTEREHEIVELWAAECFQHLLFNLINAEQKKEIYGEFGLDWKWVRGAVIEAFSDESRREAMTDSTDIFRVLIKTLLHAGIITDRTRHVYAQWVDMGELQGESPEVVGTDVAEAAIETLRDINRGRKRIGKALRSVQLD